MKKLFIIGCAIIFLGGNIQQSRYCIYENTEIYKSYENYKDALFFAMQRDNSYIFDTYERKWIWHNEPKFSVGETDFYVFAEAVVYAKEKSGNVTHIPTSSTLWADEKIEKKKVNVPIILQMPKLPRGCSVVSLAMLLGHAPLIESSNIKTEDLAERIRKSPAVEDIKDGTIYFGNPHNGFVGDMYSFKNPGLGVYWPAVLELMQEYLEDNAINFTGADFIDIEYHLDNGYPIWVMSNAKHKPLKDSDFQTWQTEDGPIKITRWMHSVVVTGYNDKYIFFSDPLGRDTHAPKKEFIAAWEQMGRQALSYVI